MVLRYVVGLALLVAALAVAHQLVVDSPLFELGAEHWFPCAPDGVAPEVVLGRLARSGAVPGAATLAAAWLVLTAPFRVWAWAVVGVVALTTALSPLLGVYGLDCREPTAGEAARLAAAPTDGVRTCVVDGARDGPVNGYAVGGPLADVVGVSEFSLDLLEPDQLAALVAHEVAHHRLHHALVRGGASVAVLAAGTAALTRTFVALTPAAAAGLAGVVAVERVVAYAAMRRTEYHADEYAARRTSPAAMVDLLETLEAAVGVDQRALAWYGEVLSTHPAYEDRIERLRRAFDGDVDRDRPGVLTG